MAVVVVVEVVVVAAVVVAAVLWPVLSIQLHKYNVQNHCVISVLNSIHIPDIPLVPLITHRRQYDLCIWIRRWQKDRLVTIRCSDRM